MTGGVIAIAAGMGAVIVIAAVVMVRLRRRAKWREHMDGFLRGLGLEVHALVPTVRASGPHRGLELAIEGAHAFAGETAIFATRITVTGGNPPRTAVQRVGVGGAPADMKAVLSGDSAFDARFRVYAGASAEALWRDADRRAQVLTLGGSGRPGELIELRCEDRKVVLTMSGVRIPPETLRAGIALACGMVV